MRLNSRRLNNFKMSLKVKYDRYEKIQNYYPLCSEKKPNKSS